jgi:tetratricopeptide (TPR) repeat protein
MHSARASFPLKFFYRPSYETIGAMYKSDPVFAIELLERLCKNNADNLVYRLTLADMYRDRGRVNNAIRLWFEILWISEEQGTVDGTNLQVYFIPIVPHQKEGTGPYGRVIDKSLAYANIGMIYFQNSFYQDASEYFSKAGDNASDPNRKADLYHQAGKAYGERGG